jgi:hypothetical protein
MVEVARAVREGVVAVRRVLFRVDVALAVAVARAETEVLKVEVALMAAFWCQPGQVKWGLVWVVVEEEVEEEVVGRELEVRGDVQDEEEEEDQVDVTGRVDVMNVLLEVEV